MNIIACVDDNMGMLFNKRRQSQDLAVIEKIRHLTSGKKLLMNEYSKALFADVGDICTNFLDIASNDDFCFVENVLLTNYFSKIDKVYIFKWNRMYPFDFKFSLNLNQDFHLIETQEFPGNSHKKITLEVWTNKSYEN